MTQVTARTRVIVAGRSALVCELCGQARAAQVHHRRPRGMGGTSLTAVHTAASLLHLCHRCHQGRVELHRAEALRMGWLLPPGADPTGEAVWLATPNGTGWWLLDDDGGSRFTTDPHRH